MPKYILFGVVTPERAWIELTNPIGHSYRHKETGIEGIIKITIYKNQITCVFETAKPVDNVRTLKNQMTDCVSDIVDCTGVENVVGYEVDLITLYDSEKNQTIVFGPYIPGLSIGDNEHRTTDIMPLLDLCGREPLYRRAIGDFRNAIRHPADTGFFCYRSVESLLNMIAKDARSDKKKAITELEKTLHLDKSCIEKLRDFSGEARHGQVNWISGNDRTIALRITREILKRFASNVTAANGEKPTFDLLIPAQKD